MRRRSGLSLIEVVIAIVLLALAAGPLAIQLAESLRSRQEALAQHVLTQLARERMHEIYADAATPTRGYAWITAGHYPREPAPHSMRGFVRTTTIREVDPSDFLTPKPGSGLKRVQVRVRGPGGQQLVVDFFVASGSGTP